MDYKIKIVQTLYEYYDYGQQFKKSHELKQYFIQNYQTYYKL